MIKTKILLKIYEDSFNTKSVLYLLQLSIYESYDALNQSTQVTTTIYHLYSHMPTVILLHT